MDFPSSRRSAYCDIRPCLIIEVFPNAMAAFFRFAVSSLCQTYILPKGRINETRLSQSDLTLSYDGLG